MFRIILSVFFFVSLNAVAQDQITNCKYKADKTVEFINESTTGIYSNVSSTKNLDVAIDRNGGLISLQGHFLCEDHNLYFLRAEGQNCDITVLTKE